MRVSLIFLCIILFYGSMHASWDPLMQTRWDAQYHHHSEGQFLSGKKAIDSFELNGTERILDVGCGTGRTTNYCASKLTTGSILGIDYCDDMIAFAKQEYGDNPRITFQTCDAAQLPFNEEFDVVYSLFCLHWMNEQKAAIECIARSLKPGGRAIIYISYASLLTNCWDAIIPRIAKDHPEWKEYFGKYGNLQPPAVWKQWCADVRLQVVSHQDLRKTRIFTSPDDAFNQLKVIEIATQMDKKEREQFIKRLIKELYVECGKHEDEPLAYYTSSLILELIK